TSLPARARAPAGLPRRRAAGQPPPAQPRPLALRDRALPPRLPRPAHRLLHGPLPAPAAAPFRRARARALPDRARPARLPDRAEDRGARDRAAAAPHTRGAPRRRRAPVLLARTDQRADH